jgi:hypothetical protein
MARRLLLPLLLLALPLALCLPVSAAPADVTSLAPARVFVNQVATSPGARILISGTGFASREIVLIRVNGRLLTGVATDLSGNFGGLGVTVPSVPATGAYSVSASGTVSGRVAIARISIIMLRPPSASVRVSPASAAAGAHVVIAGAGFNPNEMVIVYFDDHVVLGISASTGGSFVDSSFVVSSGMAAGHYSVVAVGVTSGRGATATLTIHAPARVSAPQVYLSALATSPGARLVVSGRGFQSRETVLIRIDGTAIRTIGADASGAFRGSVAAPRAYGRHILSATGTHSGWLVTLLVFTIHPVRPGIGLLPNWAYPGGLVRVNGTSFAPHEIVLIYFRGKLMQATTADRNGRFFKASFHVPAGTPIGYAPIRLLGAVSGRSNTTLLRVVRPAPLKPAVTVSPASPHRGSNVILSGHGFAGKEIVLVRYRGTLVTAFTTDSHGNFRRVSIRIPSNSPYGAASISLLGTRSHRSAAAKVRVIAVHHGAVAVVHRAVIAATPTNGVHHEAPLTVWGRGFAPHERIRIYLHGKLVLVVTADSHGNLARHHFTVTFAIPAGTTVLQAVGVQSGHRAQVRVFVY